jgi:putative membrane protein
MKRLAITLGCLSIVGLSLAKAETTDKSSQDQAFVNEAARGGKMEVELGHLAERNASTPAVKEFGSRMVKDHTRLNNELGSVAASIGLQVPKDLLPDQQSEYANLEKLSGKSFDKEYMDSMIKDHTDDLAAFEKAESATQNNKLKKAIADAIPIIQEHLSMAKSDSQKVAVR